ncbi:hypothetical protein [Desulfobotulus mexicanus]|uniref:DUF3352 domain-containing protein n=1 Tax=Desulfobotulus mexicanus TaxID=2586642 RepID=A0A5Q4VBT4_9BACT|nr:hypothetical protein [Desulfobotulus mexicanus]TYT75149.1 hypothetical protein FIM25_05390 [Desulfobotulus mexicanus]
MKKNVIFFALLVVSLSGFAAWYLMKHPDPSDGPHIASVLPADTLLLLSINNAAEQMEEFRNSPLAKAINGIDLEASLERAGFPYLIPDEMTNYREWLSLKWNQKIFNSIFGREAALAILPEALAFMTPYAEPEDMLKGIAIIARPVQGATLVSFISPWAPGLDVLEIAPHGDIKIRQINLENGMELFTSDREGLMLGAFHLETLKRMLDASSGSIAPLEKNKNFASMEKALGDGPRTLSFYMDFATALPLVDEKLASFAKSGDVSDWNDIRKMLQGFKNFGYARFNDGTEIRRSLGRAGMDKKELDPDLLALMERPARKPEPLWMAPPETELFFWNGSFDLEYTIQSILEDPEDQSAFRTAFEMQTGILFEDLINSLGHEMAFIMTGADEDSVFPLPRLAIMLESQSPEILTSLMQNLVNKAEAASGIPLNLQSRIIESVEITQVQIPMGEDIQPGWATMGKYFVFALHWESIADMVRAESSGINLVSDDLFQSVDKGLSGKNKSVTYVRSEALMDTVLALAMWQATNLAGGNTHVLVSEIFEPLLEGLKMYRASGSHGYTEKGDAVFQTFTRIQK